MTFSTSGNMFDANVEALVNPVNCVGVMGKGLALEFKKKYFDNFLAYCEQCRNGRMRPGVCYFYRVPMEHENINFDNPFGARVDYIINFPTKVNWQEPSRVEWIEAGLINLRAKAIANCVKSVAVPKIGCGLGGLDWRKDVRPLIEKYLDPIPNIAFLIYE